MISQKTKMSSPIVIDEWIFADLCGENEKEKQGESFSFLVKLVQICDKIVILRDSPFVAKLFDFREKAVTPELRGISQYIYTAIYSNSSKAVLVAQDEIRPLPPKLAKLIPRDDGYLFQLHLRVSDSFIVTSDGKLFELVRRKKGIKIFLRDRFVRDYLSRTD